METDISEKSNSLSGLHWHLKKQNYLTDCF